MKTFFFFKLSLPFRFYLDAVLHLHVSQQFAADAEEAEVTLVVVDHAVPLRGRLDEAGTQAAFRTLQGAQQVAVHGVDQTGSLWTNSVESSKIPHEDFIGALFQWMLLMSVYLCSR